MIHDMYYTIKLINKGDLQKTLASRKSSHFIKTVEQTEKVQI